MPARRALRRSLALRVGLSLACLAGAALPLLGPASPVHAASPDTSQGQRRGLVHPRAAAGVAVPAASSTNLAYGGGSAGQGVTTGHPQVYLVFWGSQWGSVTSLLGPVTLSGDPRGVAPYLQGFFAGLGTNGETWDGVATQYCQGVAAGSASCPATAAHVAYPTGGALAGVWVDSGAAAPVSATWQQIAQEALNAAGHFGNTAAAANRNAQYFVVSATGTHPDGFGPGGSFCAWHGDAATSAGTIAFTNFPYIPDLGASCGANGVNAGAGGLLDGVSMVAGHEFAETLTDQYVGWGWSDAAGEEAADKCDWWAPGKATDLALASGSFAVQAIWGNDAGGCQLAHPIVTTAAGGGPSVSLLNPGGLVAWLGTTVNLALSGLDSAGSPLTYSATGLPAGLFMNSSTGVISGVASGPGSYTVTVVATDAGGASSSVTFTLTVTAPPAAGRAGYWMLGAAGAVYPFGPAPGIGSAPVGAGQTAVAIASSPSGNGYWVAGSGGAVYAFGDARFFGSGPALQAGEHITSISAIPDGSGYWLFSDRGRVFPFGAAEPYGDMGGHALNGPVLGGIATPSGHGYYLVASDGGIFAYGDAQFEGSMGGHHLNQPVVGLVPVPGGGGGYWLVASDGGTFAFGGAGFQGSMGGKHLNRPIIGMVPYGNGYLMVASDGGIFDFSNTAFAGSLGGQALPAPIVAVTALLGGS